MDKVKPRIGKREAKMPRMLSVKPRSMVHKHFILTRLIELKLKKMAELTFQKSDAMVVDSEKLPMIESKADSSGTIKKLKEEEKNAEEMTDEEEDLSVIPNSMVHEHFRLTRLIELKLKKMAELTFQKSDAMVVDSEKLPKIESKAGSSGTIKKLKEEEKNAEEMTDEEED